MTTITIGNASYPRELLAASSGGAAPGNSQSQSKSFIPSYAEEPFLNAIAQYAGQVGQNVYNWAQGEYAKNSSLTDANINNYLNTSAKSLGMAQNDLSRYEQKFQPEEDQLLEDANKYASKDRILDEMGKAESGQMQGNEAALANHKRDLQAYGIDPSSGRYAGLDEAARVSGAAAAVGSAQQARQNTEQVGRDLRSQAIQVGAQYPGRVINSLNTTLQGIAGAENAGLANANTGVALMDSANPFLSTASSLKYPPLGTESSSSSQSYAPSGGGGGGGGSKSPSGSGGGSPSGGGGTGGGTDLGSGSGPGSDSAWSDAPYQEPVGEGSGFNWDTGSGADYSGLGNTNWTGGGGLADYSGDYSGGTMPSGNYGNSYAPSDGSVFDTGTSGFDSYYAEGGAIDDDGGAIPESASPSGGQQVDDVQAQLPSGKQINVNANEFVVPEDVTRWKGEEFFQKLIMQARQARVTAPAKPSFGAAHA